MPQPQHVYKECPRCGGKKFTAATYYHDCECRGPKEKEPPEVKDPIPVGNQFCQTCGKYRYEVVFYCHGCHKIDHKELKPPTPQT